MMAETDQRPAHVQRCIEGDLVDIVDNDIELLMPQIEQVVPRNNEVEGVARAASQDAYAVGNLLPRSTFKAAAEQRDAMAHRGDPSKCFVQMNLGATR